MREDCKNISDRIITNYPPEAEVDNFGFSKLTTLTNFDFKIKTHKHSFSRSPTHFQSISFHMFFLVKHTQ